MRNSKIINIQAFSDIICPWCFIGKRRLDSVTSKVDDLEVQVRWRPYQLYPGISYEGIDRREYLRRKNGGDSDKNLASPRIREEAESVGIDLRYDLIDKIPNTAYAHHLLEWSLDYKLQHELAEALFEAYFCRGIDIGDPNALIEVSESVGLSKTDVEQSLNSVSGKVDMTDYLDLAREHEIYSVPGYLFDNGYLLPGAQAEETIGHVLRRISEKSE